MKINNNSYSSVKQKIEKKPSWVRTLIFALEISLVISLLIIWFSSESLQTSKNLWVLFFFSFPGEFLIPIVPHEPVLILFGKFHPPLTVAFVAIVSTLMTEAINYSAFNFISDTSPFRKIRHKKTVEKIVNLFNKAPFLAIWIAGLTPIPFYPFRFLVVIARYPLIKYLLAVFLSRTPRFFILAFAGNIIKIPDYLLIILFIGITILINYPVVSHLLKKRRKNKKKAS